MSSSPDDGSMLDTILKSSHLHTIVSVQAAQDRESLLSNSYDDQIKLVEHSVAISKNADATDTKKSNSKKVHDKPSTRYQKQEQKAKVNTDKLKFTNRSRIYRFDGSQTEDSNQIKPPPFHPPLDVIPNLLAEDETDTRSAMLMAWYMAGYHTGYYEAMKKYNNKDQANQNSDVRGTS